jgi:hypothetical protein
MTRPTHTRWTHQLRRSVRPAALLLLLAAACGRRATPPAAPTGDPPIAFTSQRAVLLPVQAAGDLYPIRPDALDAELLFAVRERAPAVSWTGAPELRRQLARAPGVAASPDRLSAFTLRGRERRLAEPLAGELRRLAALSGARLVVLPYRAVVLGTGADTSVEVHLAVVDTRADAAVWLGVHREPVPDESAAQVAGLAGRVAARLIRAAGEPAAEGLP